MISIAFPAPGTERQTGMIWVAKCLHCDNDLVLNYVTASPNWYHYRTGRGLCFVGVRPSQDLIAQFAINL